METDLTNITRNRLKQQYIDQLLQHIERFSQLGEAARIAVCESFEERVFSKNEFLVTEGKTCRHLYFLKSGALRGYYNMNEKEVTYWFGFEGDFVTSFHSFITQQPAVENIQLLEGSVLYAISKDRFSRLLNEHPELEKLLRIAYERYYIRLEERFVNAQFKSATERYHGLLKQTPHIVERVALGHIASYLGISQETLSRVRGRR